MKLGVVIKSVSAGLLAFCVLVLCAGAARADDWLGVPGGSKDIEVYVKKQSDITFGVRMMDIKFVNHSDVDLAVAYTAILRCPGLGSKDADTGKSYVKRHSETITSFAYTLCAGDATDDTSMFEVRVKPSMY